MTDTKVGGRTPSANRDYSTLRDLCLNLQQYDHLHIASPSHQKRRAAVAAILRWHRGRTDIPVDNSVVIDNLEQFFEQPWVKEDDDGRAEILFMQRTARVGDRWSGHVSFVGGKNEPTDLDDEDTVKREVLEEIGIDLNNKEQYLKVGLLDEREISSIRDNKLLMILIPFVYLQVVPISPPFQLQPSEVAAVEWVPLSVFLSPNDYQNNCITEPLQIFNLKRRSLMKKFVHFMLGTVTFPGLDLPTQYSNNSYKQSQSKLRLWGLTMGMTSDLVEFTSLKPLAFVKLTKSKPRYSRHDIGLLTLLVAQFRYYIWRRVLMWKKKGIPARANNNGLRGKDQEWDKIYFSSIRPAVAATILLRMGLAGLIMFVLLRKRLLFSRSGRFAS